MKINATYYVLSHPNIPSLDCVSTNLEEFRKMVAEERQRAIENEFWHDYADPTEITLVDYPLEHLLTWRSDPDDSSLGSRPDCEDDFPQEGVTRRIMSWKEVLDNVQEFAL